MHVWPGGGAAPSERVTRSDQDGRGEREREILKGAKKEECEGCDRLSNAETHSFHLA